MGELSLANQYRSESNHVEARLARLGRFMSNGSRRLPSLHSIIIQIEEDI
jgi:hypothetical protein